MSKDQNIDQNKILLESIQDTNDSLKIEGITHNSDGVSNSRPKFFRKISTGFAPYEPGFNADSNSPKAAGFFRIMVKQEKNIRGKIISQWILDRPMQEILEKFCNSKEPRLLPIMFFHSDPTTATRASMAKWSNDGLECESKGTGRPYNKLEYDESGEAKCDSSGNNDLYGNPIVVCDVNNCEFRNPKKPECKPYLEFTLFPKIPGYEPTPLEPWVYRTPSSITLKNFGSSINQILNLMRMSYNASEGKILTKEELVGKSFFFGKKLFLKHYQIKSSKGSLVWVTDIVPTKTLKNELMAPVNLGLAEAEKQNKEVAKKLADKTSKILLGDNSSEEKGLLGDAASDMIDDKSKSDDNTPADFTEAIIVEEDGLKDKKAKKTSGKSKIVE